ncbi:carboxypeptidase-like regulatory domain-containing protein [Leeuwenhoekiella sp. A16]|uniref:carboxypeptidase-like regulatory domain-containing protein n=1 Tax=unclassified Leeuwenhoekiella TaxID=2615029 RepID=UPI003A7F923F
MKIFIKLITFQILALCMLAVTSCENEGQSGNDTNKATLEEQLVTLQNTLDKKETLTLAEAEELEKFLIRSQSLVSSSNLTHMISGTVTAFDTGKPLPGVNIVEKETSNGVVTDFDGNYTIELKDENPTLSYSYIDYKKKEIQVNGKSTLDAVLEVKEN